MEVTSFLGVFQNVYHIPTGKRSVASYLILLIALSVLAGCPTALEPNDSAERNYDLEAPVEPGTSPPVVGDEYDTLLQWSWTGSGGGSGFFRARLNHADEWAEGVTSPWPDPAIDHYPGTYVFEVQERDNAGNWSEVSGEVTTVKVREPTITASPAGYTNNNQPSFTWTQWSGPPAQYGAADLYPFCLEQRVEGAWVPIDDQTGTIDPPTPGQGTYTASRLLPDGEYRFCVAERNEGGSRSDYTTATFTIDTTPPAGPVISGPTFVSTSGGAETYTWTGDAGDTVVEYVYRVENPTGGVVLGPTTVPSGNPQTLSYDFPNGTAGTYTIYVSQTDEAGNIGTGTLLVGVEDSPGLSITNYTGTPNYSNIDSVQFSATSAGVGMSGLFQYHRSDDGGSTWGAWTPTTPVATLPDDSLVGQPDGTYTYEMREQREDGVTFSDPSPAVDLIRDTAPPAPATTITGAPPISSNNANPTFDVVGEGGAVYQYSTDGGTSFGATIVDGGGGDADGTVNGTVGFSAALTDGTYTLVGRVTDAAGNTSDSIGYNFTIDTTPPAVPVFTAGPADGSYFRSGQSPSYTVTTEPSASVDYYYDGGFVGNVTAGGGGTATFVVTTSPPDGPVLVGAIATDSVGNASADGTRTLYVDDTVPVTLFLGSSPPNGGEINTTSVTYRVDATDGGSGVHAVLYDITGPVNRSGSATNLGGGTWEFTEAGLGDGTYTVQARAADVVGNMAPDIARMLVVDITAPSAPTAPTSAQLQGTAPNQYTYELPVFTWGGIEAGATVEYSLDGGTSWSTVGVGSTSYTVPVSTGFDRLFTLRQIDTAGNVSTNSAQVQFDYITEIRGRWSFPSAALWYLDSSGNGYDLTAAGGGYSIVTTPTPYVEFTGTNNATYLSNVGVANANDLAISFWKYGDFSGALGQIVGRYSAANARIWTIGSNVVGGSLNILDSGGYVGGIITHFADYAAPLNSTGWNHIVVNIGQSSGNVTAWINGAYTVSRPFDTSAVVTAGSKLVIGSDPAPGAGAEYAQAGRFADFRYYNDFLTQDEIDAIYAAGIGGSWPP